MSKINTYLLQIESFLTDAFVDQKNIAYFRKSVYALLFLKLITLWPEIPAFYQYVVSLNESYTGFSFFSHFIFLPIFQNHINVLIGVCLVIVLLGIFLQKNVVISIAIFLISTNFISLIYRTKNGGDLLLNFFTLLIIFLAEKERSQIKFMINNCLWLILKVNVCMIYFVNGYVKIHKPIWVSGDVMQTIWQLSYYANPNLIPKWFSDPNFGRVTAWTVILFELAFPILIWFKSLKNYMIVMGIIFHIFIAIFLSLPEFGLTMMIAYIPFIDFSAIFRAQKKVVRNQTTL